MSHLSVRMLAAAVLTASLWLVMPTAEVRDVYTGPRNFSIATPHGNVHNVVVSGGFVLRF